ncbi:hypothetical protein RCL1_007855 [Eukaryota sp. TZLM3-RCL]
MSYPCYHQNCTASLEDYKEISRIGAGSQGLTFLVKDKHNNLYCLKKMFNPESVINTEVQVSSRDLKSPFLVDFHHCFVGRDNVFLLMEYCQGGSLYDFLKTNQLLEQDVWDIFSQLVLGLKFLHGEGVLHRDVKHGNILLLSQERPFRVKLCDFGIARDLNATVIKTSIGTESFMAPEMFANQPYGTAVDIWALGVVLYFIIEKKYPFDSPLQLFTSEAVISESPFKEIISQLLTKDPNKRPSADQLSKHPRVVEYYNFFNQKPKPPVDVEILEQQVVQLSTELAQLRTDNELLVESNKDLVAKLVTALNSISEQLEIVKQNCDEKCVVVEGRLDNAEKVIENMKKNHDDEICQLKDFLKQQQDDNVILKKLIADLNDKFNSLVQPLPVSTTVDATLNQSIPVNNLVNTTGLSGCLASNSALVDHLRSLFPSPKKFVPAVLHSLRKIQISNNSALVNLIGIDFLNSLQLLELYNCSKLVDISDISKCKHLGTLRIHTCPSLSNITVITGLKKIHTLSLYDQMKFRILQRLPSYYKAWACDLCSSQIPESGTHVLHCNEVVHGFDVCCACLGQFDFDRFSLLLSSRQRK